VNDVSDHATTPEPGQTVAAMNKPDLVRAAQQREADAARRRGVAADWRPIVRWRLRSALVLLVLWVAGIEARLVYLQVSQHDELRARAERQLTRRINVPGKRGDLLDRQGRVLAYSVDGDVIFAEPTLVRDPAGTATRVCAAIEGCGPAQRVQMAERLAQRRPFVYLWRKASPLDARRVGDLKIRGVGLMREDRRYYPHRELAAHVLGYVGQDVTGLGGVEAAFDTLIAGRPGYVLLQTDARHQAFARQQQAPTEGATLELTIDAYLQYVAERELEAGIREFAAQAGTVVVMDPHEGDVLALANYPSFNPNAYNDVGQEQRRNRAVQELYEPGSTFKIVTASAALEERLARPADVFDVSRGSISFGSRVIRDTHRYGPLSFNDVIVKSSNVGAILIGQRLGPDRLSKYVEAFGFGQPSLRALPGETRGIVWRPETLGAGALASVSMGYQIGVTPIQVASAFSAIANGGEAVPPRVVRATVENGVRRPLPPRPARRVVSPETAATMTAIMEGVVEAGTAKAARLADYTVAGKTGTAKKVENGRYINKYNASFAGFVPSRAPVITVLVVIDSPHGKGYYGGAVAAPIFKRVAEQALRYLAVPPTVDPVPPLVVERRDPPPPGPAPTPARAARVLAGFAGQPATDGLMPDLRGMGAREAARALARLGLVAEIDGDGLVIDQTLSPGAAVERGMACRLTLARRLVLESAAAGPAPALEIAP
jgi:cell division protein FtsI (penicillin-binding protein 3)